MAGAAATVKTRSFLSALDEIVKAQDLNGDTKEPFARRWPVSVALAAALVCFATDCASISAFPRNAIPRRAGFARYLRRCTVHLTWLQHEASRTVEKGKVKLH